MTIRSLAFAALGAAVLATPAPAATQPWTLDDILQVRSVSDPQLSPDGTRLAYVVQDLKPDGSDYQTDVWLAPVSNGQTRRLTAAPENDELPRWSPDGTWIAFVSERPRPGHKPDEPGDEGKRQIWLVRPDGGEATPLTDAAGGVSDFAWSADGRFLAFLSKVPKTEERKKREKDKDDAFTPEMTWMWNRLWTIDVATRTSKALTPPDSHVSSFSIAPDGRTICVAMQPTPRIPDSYQSDLWLVPAAGGAPTALVRRKGSDLLPAYSPDGKRIAFVSQDGRSEEWWSNTYVCVVPVAGGTPANLTSAFDERIGGIGANAAPIWAADGQAVYFASLLRTDGQVFRAWLDERGVESVTRGVGVNASPTLGRRGERMAWTHEDAAQPRDVWVWEMNGGTPRRLTDANPQVRGKPAFAKQLLSWQGPDGRQIEGLLLTPDGIQPGSRCPLVLSVHGGPAGTHSQTFTAGSRTYPWPILLQEGWAILMANPRGSGGYGEKFRSANLRDWGGADYLDLMAGVDAVVRLGIADEKRLAVCGWSYGGFMTSTIVTKTNRFRAAIVGAGVTDLGSMATTTDIPEFQHSYFGAWPWEDPTLFVEHSAIYHAGSIRTPTAFVHGGADERVPTSQGWELFGALREFGVPTDMLVLPREPHGPREPRHQRAILQFQHDWLARWTLGTPATVAKPRERPAGARAADGTIVEPRR